MTPLYPHMQNLESIDAIIFDLGGVIINLDYNETANAFIDAGIHNFNDIYGQLKQTTLFDDFETGRIGKKEFIQSLKSISTPNISDEQIVNCWNAMLLNLPKYRLDALVKLQSSFKTFLFSNTNIIHIEAFNHYLKQEHGYDNLNPFFRKVYLSHELGHRKPHPDGFERILNENNLAPNRTLFIDDTPGHIEGAQQLGIQTYFNPTNQNVFEIFSDFIA